MIKKIYYYLLILKLSFKWCWKINLKDYVWYRGKKYVVLNGVSCNSWRLVGLDNGQEGWVPRHECGKLWTVENIVGSFKSGYNFYMTSWFDIWVREGIKPWMKNCNIW